MFITWLTSIFFAFIIILQIRFASVDLELHTKYVPGGSESIYDVDRRVSEKTQVIPPLPEDRFLCSFSHIFAGLLSLSNLLSQHHFYFFNWNLILWYFLLYKLFVNIRWICGWILQLQGIIYSCNIHYYLFNSYGVILSWTLGLLCTVACWLLCIFLPLSLFWYHIFAFGSGLRCCQQMHSLHLRMLDWMTTK